MNRLYSLLAIFSVLLLSGCDYFGNAYNWVPRGYMGHQEQRKLGYKKSSTWDEKAKFRDERTEAVADQWNVMAEDAIAWLQSRGLAANQSIYLQSLNVHEKEGLTNEFSFFMGERLVDNGYFISTQKNKSIVLNYDIQEATPEALKTVSMGALQAASNIKKPYAPYVVRLSLADPAGRLLAERMGVYALVKQYE